MLKLTFGFIDRFLQPHTDSGSASPAVFLTLGLYEQFRSCSQFTGGKLSVELESVVKMYSLQSTSARFNVRSPDLSEARGSNVFPQ